jgi:hypothetical protein
MEENPMKLQVKNSIPHQRLLTYLLLLGLIPLILAFSYYNVHSQDLQEISGEIERLQFVATNKRCKQYVNGLARAHFQQADHFYLDKYVESMHLLECETEALQTLLEHEPTLPNKDILKRLDFLTGPQNELTFADGMTQTFANIQETTESLIHPVEVDLADIQRILSYIEGTEIALFAPAINRPQFIIVDFKINRKQSASDNEVYVLELKLIKREYL